MKTISIGKFVAAVAVLCVIAGVVGTAVLRNRYSPPAKAFEGDTRKLTSTVVVPTLETAMPKGKNVVWCASFQAAWDRLKNDLAGEPVRVAHAEAVADQLNRGSLPAGTLPQDSSYAAAGFVRDGIVQKIRNDMKARFQKEPMDLSDEGAVAVAYGYLQASVPFTIPYFENDERFEFTDSQGKNTAVSSFGLRFKDNSKYSELRKQPEVLFAAGNEGWAHPTEFALDLCRDSKPNQVIAACIPRKATLQNVLDDLDRKLANPVPEEACIGNNALLLVPNLNWSLSHHFAELEGPDKILLNSKLEGLYLAIALQTIDFRLDRSGVELKSEAKIVAKSAADPCYFFNQPFLIVVKKRGATKPFFVMWVDNAELLSKPR